MVIQKGPASVGLFCCQVLKSVKIVGVLIFVLKKGLILYQETNTNTHNHEHKQPSNNREMGFRFKYNSLYDY